MKKINELDLLGRRGQEELTFGDALEVVAKHIMAIELAIDSGDNIYPLTKYIECEDEAT